MEEGEKCYCGACKIEFNSITEWDEHAKECETIKAFSGYLKKDKEVEK